MCPSGSAQYWSCVINTGLLSPSWNLEPAFPNKAAQGQALSSNTPSAIIPAWETSLGWGKRLLLFQITRKWSQIFHSFWCKSFWIHPPPGWMEQSQRMCCSRCEEPRAEVVMERWYHSRFASCWCGLARYKRPCLGTSGFQQKPKINESGERKTRPSDTLM